MFNFGTNWLDYSLRVLDQQHVDTAMLALAELLGSEVFRGKRFVDIGFGSGIVSIGAGMLGAESVVGIDVDVVDWLGGYPYEYATPSQVKSFVTALGFELVKKKAAQTPIGCNEFVFRKLDGGTGSE